MQIVLPKTGGSADYRNVLRRVHRSLKWGGSVIVSELPYPDSGSTPRRNPIPQKLAGLQLHAASIGCGMIAQGEVRSIVEQAGSTTIRVAEQLLPTHFVMSGEKLSSFLPHCHKATQGGAHGTTSGVCQYRRPDAP